MKNYKKLLVSIFALFSLQCSIPSTFAYTEFVSPTTNPAFKFQIFDPQDGVFIQYPGSTYYSAFSLDSKFYNPLYDAGQYWTTILKRNANSKVSSFLVYTKNFENAAAGSELVNVNGQPYTYTYLQAMYNGLNFDSSKVNIGAEIQIGTLPFVVSQHSVLPLSGGADFLIIIAHEIGHALGISVGDSSNLTFQNPLPIYASFLKVKNNGTEISATPGMKIEVNNATTTTGSNIFNITKDAPYFIGPNVQSVLSEAIAQGGLTHYQEGGYYKDSAGNLQKVAGLPINGKEEDANGNYIAELSHIELRNSYMSHQDYRNWSIFMEAELALLKDLGYDIDLRNHYGKSFYQNNATVTNTNGYFARNSDGTAYLTDEYNETPYGVGLHIYGDNNNITQAANILTKGEVSVGARIDGVGNSLTVKNGTKIHSNGNYSVGILTAWGKNHNITIENGAEVTATGESGVAADFDFGTNINGEQYAHRGSYIGYAKGQDYELYDSDDIYGPLVNSFNINGKLEGNKAAIYIGDSAYVKEININNGSEIKGDILSAWNSKTSGPNAKVQAADTKMTNLNFNNYNNTFNNDIVGTDTLKINVKDNLTYNNGTASVYDLTNSGNLSGSAKYIISNKFENNNTYTATDGAAIQAKNVKNTGTMTVSGEFYLDSNVSGGTTGVFNVGNGTDSTILSVSQNTESIDNTVNVNAGSLLNFANNDSADTSIGKMVFNSDANMAIDFDVDNTSVDSLKFNATDDLEMNGHTLNITGVNVLNSRRKALTQTNYEIPIISSDLHNENLNVNLSANMPASPVITPIFKYNLGYQDNAFLLNVPYGGGSSNYDNLNPAVVSAPVGAQVGTYLNQLNSYEQAFANFDMTIALPSAQRQALKYANRYASTDTKAMTFSPNQDAYASKGLWFKPYTTFENVGLKNGPNVGNVAYGSYFGGDSDLISLKKGWDLVYGVYAGYNGSHQTYDGVGVYQNGGQLGGNVFAYKNNFWTGLTANVGANIGEANTMYGNEQFTMLGTGIASKTGYNFEFKEGKFILQPNYLMSYSFVNTFDYENAAGVNISSNPLHAIQIAPGLKFIGNLKNGWQPYLGIQMIWNILDKSDFTANNVSLPDMSVKPYIQYGLGVQKRWGERLTGYAQTMIRNGGRNGIALSAGFHWTLGK